MGGEFLSPADDAASKIIVKIEEASAEVKSLIAESIREGVQQEELTKRLNAEIARQCDEIDEPIKNEMRRALVTGAKRWYWQIRQTINIAEFNLRATLSSAKTPDVRLTDLLSKMASIREDSFRTILDDGANRGIPVIEDYQKSIRLAIRVMAAEPPKINVRGAVVPLRNRAEMATRYAASVRDLARLREAGVDLVWTSSHPNCSERCRTYQGKLWSLTGKSGVIDGIPYKPIEEALRGIHGDGNGIISGYNCRHRLIVYTRGSRAPNDYSESYMLREYALDQIQRRQENAIRKLKIEEKTYRSAGFITEAKACRKRWRLKQAQHIRWCQDNDRPHYPYRYIIDAVELNDLT